MVYHQTQEREVGGSKPTTAMLIVYLSKTLYSPKVLVIPRKQWLRPDMTEKLLTGTLNLKQTNLSILNSKMAFHSLILLVRDMLFATLAR